MTITFVYYNEDGDEENFTLPSRKEVCPSCWGTGTHVNRAIDGNGITGSEMDELGDEFFEDYMSGVYDVPCEECNGQNVVDVVDEVRADPVILEKYQENLNDEWEYQAERAAEIRAGC